MLRRRGGQTFTFGVAAEPTSLDGALAPDVESRRVIAQIFDGLVAQRPGTTDLEPALATSWRPSEKRAVWTFRLRPRVTFQDGTPLDAAAVCANFDRGAGDPELRLLERPPYDVGYVTINQTKPPMDKLLVRQAVAYGLDRRRLAGSFQPRGSAVVADLFQPPVVFGYSTDAARFRYKPAESKRLLRLAGLDFPVRLDLWYPSGVSRPYLPDPQGAFRILARGLGKAGFKVVGHTAPWTRGYLSAVEKGKAGQLNLVGWTGDFGDPNDFLGTLFSRPTGQFGFSEPYARVALGI